MGDAVSTDFKSSNRIEISRLVQVLLNFDWFQGSPLGGGGGWLLVEGSERFPHTCAHTCTCMHMHECMTSYRIPRDSPWGWPFAWNYHVYHTYMCVHVCVCMCTYVGGTLTTTHHPHPPTPHPNHPHPHPPTPNLPEPQGAQITKIQ